MPREPPMGSGNDAEDRALPVALGVLSGVLVPFAVTVLIRRLRRRLPTGDAPA
jgi:hypothetical protein